MLNWIKRLRFKHPANPDHVSYSVVPGPTAGPAQQSVFHWDAATRPPAYFIGPGKAAHMALNVFQPTQPYYLQHAPVSSIGGSQAGSLYSQPLINDPESPLNG